jgi:hypothetical protein
MFVPYFIQMLPSSDDTELLRGGVGLGRVG